MLIGLFAFGTRLQVCDASERVDDPTIRGPHRHGHASLQCRAAIHWFATISIVGSTQTHTARFCMLQLLGWLPFALLQLLISTDDQPLLGLGQVFCALVLTALAVAGSLVLRETYRRARVSHFGELRLLGLVLGASLSVAVVVDLLFHFGLSVVAGTSTSLASIYAAQPMFSRAPLVALMYLLWSLLYLALSRQKRLQRAAAAENELQLALKQAQIQRLLGQLSPHFTFNALNNIRALILRDPEAARSLLARFASTLRHQFANSELALVSIADEMAVVRDYLALLRMQLGSRLQYEERVAPAVTGLQVPRFALQLLVENAIKHGLEPNPQPGVLSVVAGLEGDVLQMDVCNTGILGDRRQSTGIGLANLEQRLQLGFGDAATLSLPQEGGLVRARIRIMQCK